MTIALVGGFGGAAIAAGGGGVVADPVPFQQVQPAETAGEWRAMAASPWNRNDA